MSDSQTVYDERWEDLLSEQSRIVLQKLRQPVRQTDFSERCRIVLQKCKSLQKHYSDLFDKLIQDSIFMDLTGDGSHNLESDGGRLLTIDMESMELSKNFEKNQFGDAKRRHSSPPDVEEIEAFGKREQVLRVNNLFRKSGVINIIHGTINYTEYDVHCFHVFSQTVIKKLNEDTVQDEKSPSLNQNYHETICRDIHSCCNEFGEEQPFLLPFTALYFKRLGRQYLSYDQRSKGMDRKLNFIRAAILLNAARVRFELYLHKYDILDDLQVLYTKLLQASGAQNCADFLAFTKKMKVKLTSLRDAEKDALKKIQALRYGNIDGNLIETQEDLVIAKIRELCAATTINYRNLLTEIISECLYVMGKPPCDFAIVGLGSLAREEVTLSSDFEHVIVLGDQKPVTNEVREYFRWFTLIFHVAVIGLGETVIPSIDIKFLCDPYLPGEHNNWFFDKYTPRGFSFDGMMPHACKTPFGRQRPTKNRKHVFELIQSASAMAQYLTTDEQMKNGYALNDVLTITCLVYGKMDVYHSFLEKCNTIQSTLSIDDVYRQHRSFLRDAVKAFKSLFDDSWARDFKLKNWIYRPLTVMLHYLACHFKLSSCSSFDILDDLKERGIIDVASHHLLCHAVGIALEIRIRIYQTTSGQRSYVIDKDVSGVLGSILYAECRSATLFLIRAVQNLTYQTIYMREKVLRLGFPSRTTDTWRSMVLQSQRKIDNDNDWSCISFINHLSFIEHILEQYGANKITTSLAHLLVRIHTSEARFRLGRYTYIHGKVIPDRYSLLMDAYKWLEQRFRLLGLTNGMNYALKTAETRDILGDAAEGRFDQPIFVLDTVGCLRVVTWCDRWNSALRWVVKNYWERPEYIQEIDGICQLEYSMKKYALSDIGAACYFALALARPTQTHFTKILFMLGFLRSVASCVTFIDRTDIYWRLREQALRIKKNAKHFTILKYTYLKKTIAKLFLDFGMTGASSEVLDSMTYSPDDLSKYAGTSSSFMLYSDVNNDSFNFETFEKLHIKYLGIRNVSLHPTLPFHEITAIGRYTTRTFNRRRCGTKLFEAAIYAQKRHTRMIFSCTLYDEMITTIEYVLLGPEKRIPTFEHSAYEVTTNEVVAFMTLCEILKFRDVHFFYDILPKASLRVRSAKILQPFLYACFKEFNPQSKEDKRTIRIQNDIFKKIFRIHIYSTEASLMLSTFNYLQLNFVLCAKVAWRMLQTKVVTEQKISVFLTSVMTIMVIRKRTNPIPHLALCKELSAAQTTVYTVDGRFMPLLASRVPFLKAADSVDTLCYNMAIDWVIFDPRAGAAMMWKLIHRGKMNSPLNTLCCLNLAFSWTRLPTRPTLTDGSRLDDPIIDNLVSSVVNCSMLLESIINLKDQR